MIFLVKSHWYIALPAAILWACTNVLMGGWNDPAGGPLALHWQVACGLGGCVAALVINGVLHEALKRFAGRRYVESFQTYGNEILGRMRWPEYLTGGSVAALAEETFFRGVLLRLFESPVVGVAIAALAFAVCHWLRSMYFGFWLWAMWEGVLFGILLVTTGSLLVPMIAHGLHDVIAYRVLDELLRRRNPDVAHDVDR